MENWKVLPLYEPYATLVVHGIKKIETRPSATSWVYKKDIYGNVVSGNYLIYSAKKWASVQERICYSDYFADALLKLGIIEKKSTGLRLNKGMFNFGNIIGAVNVIECKKIHITDGPLKLNPHYFNGLDENNKVSITYIHEPELSFGDYRGGRYAWLLQNARILEKPIPYKAQQGYYQNYHGDVSQLIFK